MPDTLVSAESPLAGLPDDLVPAAERLFLNARTPQSWSDRPVPLETLHRLYKLVRLAPTAFNGSPARFVFLTTPEAKERLRPALSRGNLSKLAAGVIAIAAYDRRFTEHLPVLSPHFDPTPLFAKDPALTETTAFRSGTLQAGYLILAARLLGLDAGPMSGFDADAVDREFFPDGRLHANILVALGHAEGPPARPRAPRLDLSQAVTIL
ncbi:malonic semialdehyde reductase [Azospirillum argentinense]|uniref:Malonic semialdehyde reductase n=1 Tax=Azospirillum argentinense TaxID=2970906 RepID=A0A060DNE1_9PROT|nr:malonic semialdehyde reductase [Azospirillum argentinense]AIB12618.1 malonic semialdehyde reductase [Azospirillum argentinense]EZQ09406.1 nitroreductase [Azospirillum argentinense]